MAYEFAMDMDADNKNLAQNQNSWFSPSNGLTRVMGFSFIASLFQGFVRGQISGTKGMGASYLGDSAKLFLLGSLIEVSRRIFEWVLKRFKPFQYSITAQFAEGDPAYEWIIHFMTEEKVWTRSRHFHVSAASSIRQWAVSLESNKSSSHPNEDAEYVPTYEEAQLFRWNGYWMEVRRGASNSGISGIPAFINEPGNVGGRLRLTIYTRDMKVLSTLVKEAKKRYIKTSRPYVVVHSVDQIRHTRSTWSTTKNKAHRPLNSIILQEGVINSLLDDAKEFFRSEAWYTAAGIPHRRGYLLHGPPGTGKSSTIYAMAGELGLEIYSLSLASGFGAQYINHLAVDDSFLARAVSSIPKRAIFLIEDIDCAFPSREDDDGDSFVEKQRLGGFPPHLINMGMQPRSRYSAVTLSGLLNVLDGVGSEEGRIFFATTNYIDRLDSALLRPGRIDKKIQYFLTTKPKLRPYFYVFYPAEYITLQTKNDTISNEVNIDLTESEKKEKLRFLSEKFAEHVPEHEFSTAELQGFLLSCKQQPERAVETIKVWVEEEQRERKEKEKRDEDRKQKKLEKKGVRETTALDGKLSSLGLLVSGSAHGEEGCDGSRPATSSVQSNGNNLSLSSTDSPAADVQNKKGAPRHGPKTSGAGFSTPLQL